MALRPITKCRPVSVSVSRCYYPKIFVLLTIPQAKAHEPFASALFIEVNTPAFPASSSSIKINRRFEYLIKFSFNKVSVCINEAKNVLSCLRFY
jgi:hypothetical protein